MENIRKRHVWACTYFDFPSNRKLSFCLCEKFLYQLTKWVENKGRSRHFSLAKMTSHVPGSCQKGITGCCWKPLQRNTWHHSHLQNTLFPSLTSLLGQPSGWARRNSDLSSPWRAFFDGKDFRFCCIYSTAVPADRPELCATACLVGGIIHQTLDSLRLF